jgi:hypothetical protein
VPSGAEILRFSAPRPPAEPAEMVVVRSDETGVWCARVGTTGLSPVGPCKGATWITGTSSTADTTHSHTVVVERLPVRTVVLVLLTDDGPWVLNHEREVT